MVIPPKASISNIANTNTNTLNDNQSGIGGKAYIAQYGLQNTEVAMQEVFSAKNGIDSCTISK